MPADDAVWLRLDRPENVLSVVSVMWTATPVDPAGLRTVVVERMVKRHPVFRCRPVLRPWPLPSEWEPDPDFAVHRHLRVEERPHSETALQALVGSLRSAEFDRHHPLWRVLLVPYDSGSAVILQVHHSVADGIRLTQLMVDLLDPLDDGGTAPAGTHLADGPSVRDLLDPRRAVRTAGDLALTAVRSLAAVGELVTWSNPHTAWSGPVGHGKNAAWGEPLSLAALTELAHHHRATVNELLSALLGGAVRRVLDHRGGSPEDLAWMVPVNLAPYDPTLPTRLGNHFSLVLAVLPLQGDLAHRIAVVRDRTAWVRGSWEPWVTAATQRFVGSAPAVLGGPVARFFADKAVGVFTNVPGPPTPMSLAGALVLGSVGWAPCSGDQAVTACVFSYAGQLFIGFGTDGRLVGDAAVLVRAFAAEAAEALVTV
ncbi:wax ester/triacylglycerol synthase family O-acyltransferase [Pseudonocardia xishanensis]|uniref:diacylglycerol O-acyltransferase n=2 Tax=Pseudonocardia xishanensis TaxID=630995 RepID=A0ABP8RSI1_9PSEU